MLTHGGNEMNKVMGHILDTAILFAVGAALFRVWWLVSR